MGLLDEGAEAGLAAPQVLLQPPPLGHVAEDDGEELAAVHFDLRDRRLDRKLRAVGAARGQRPEGSHVPPGDIGLAEVADVAVVAGAVAVGDEAVEGLPQRVVGRHPEHPLGRGVEEEDALFLVDRDHRVHRRADDADEARLAVAQRLLRPPALGDVVDIENEAADVGIGQQVLADHLQPAPGAVLVTGADFDRSDGVGIGQEVGVE